MDPNNNVINQFSEDDAFKPFLKEDLDVRQYAAAAILNTTVAEQLAKLSTGISLLDKELHDQVANQYEDLLSQATEIETLEEVLEIIQNRIQTLMSTADRLRNKVVEPFNHVVNQASMLSRLQQACDLLRRISRILQLSERLQEQLKAGEKNITKAAQNLNELDYVMEGVCLNDIEILKKDLNIIRQARKEVEKQAQLMLEKGIENLDPNQVGTALQVFHNLQILSTTVQKIVSETTSRLRQNVQNALDIKTLNQPLHTSTQKGLPGRSTLPTVGNSVQFRATLWTNVEKITEDVYTACSQMHHLQKVIAKKRDPVSHVLFADELVKSGIPNLMQSFWNAVTTILTESLVNAAKNSSAIMQTFQGEFPKLLRLYLDLWHRLQQLGSSTIISSDTVSVQFAVDIFKPKISGENYNPERELRGTLETFETAYLAKSLSIMIDKVNLAFNEVSGDAPEARDVDIIVETISKELMVANFDVVLGSSVAQNVVQTIKKFTEKCAALMLVNDDAKQVIGPPNETQILTGQIVNLLSIFSQKLIKFLNGTKAPIKEVSIIISRALQDVETEIESSVQPLLEAVGTAIFNIILTMHEEDFTGSISADSNSSQQCSLYMRELQSFIDRSHKDYFTLYPEHPIVQKSLQHVASRAMELFVRHASLIRPLEEKGKMKLATDFAQMEMALAPLCEKLGELGRPYRMLRSFRPLLFQTPQHIATSPVVGDILPYSVVLQFLFSRGPADLKSPYEASGWKIKEYSKWLDENPLERKRLVLIRTTLDAYVQLVKQKKEKEFCLVYPVMMELLQKAVEIEK